ncbi:hypothetical protein AGMMS49942_14770 [Spirochaetia bacterium]|nr:hypothetical protein AGMMS49942_14770 [Spirochaetia bacterium]
MDRYSVIPRYPDELEITSTDTDNAIKYAKEIRDFVKGKRSADAESKTVEGDANDTL